MEFCWIHENKVVIDYNGEKNIKIKGLKFEDLKDSKIIKIMKENPELTIACGCVVAITISTIAEITLNHSVAIACNAGGMDQVEVLLSTVTKWAKKALTIAVSFNQIKDAAMILWRNGGSKMSWDDIFGSLFKNLAILGVGLAADKAAWALYEALA